MIKDGTTQPLPIVVDFISFCGDTVRQGRGERRWVSWTPLPPFDVTGGKTPAAADYNYCSVVYVPFEPEPLTEEVLILLRFVVKTVDAEESQRVSGALLHGLSHARAA